MGDVLDPRTVVLDTLTRVLGKRQPLDEVLATAEHRIPTPRDRAFARRLAATTLRRCGQADAVIDALLDRPLRTQQLRLRNILRLGVTEVLFTETPAYAAVDNAVRLARSSGLAPYAKLVNAILRRTERESAALLQRIPPVPTNTPAWLWQRWHDRFGIVTATAIANQHLAVPPLDLTPREPSSSCAETLGGALLASGSIRLFNAGRVAELAGYEDGAWWVQDTAATLPARLLGDVAGVDVLELCAAPGGKTAQLAAAGARVTAVDRAEQRLQILRKNLQRLQLDAHCILSDVATYHPAKKQSHILLDAPCSATGTIRRNPDIPWTRAPADIATAAGHQRQLLRAAVNMLAPGGCLVYAVCSLEPEEGIAQIEGLLAEDTSINRQPISAGEIGGMTQCVTSAGDLMTLPCHLADLGGMDGFFAARLCRQ